MIGDIGGFGALFALEAGKCDDPVLVSSTDGVGTKAMIATATGRYDTIGIDLVAMCVDDIVCQGAEPLWFLDYISVGRLDPDQIEQLVSGVADGCRQAGCALIGGEMAEHPGAMGAHEFDLVGFAVGVVERAHLVTPDLVQAGDVLIGLPSPGLRSNGYSLARRVLLDVGGRRIDEPAWTGAKHSLADELLRPSVIYAPAVRALAAERAIHGVSHITGGGLPGNVPRMLPAHLDAVIDRATWDVPEIFGEIARCRRHRRLGDGSRLQPRDRDGRRGCVTRRRRRVRAAARTRARSSPCRRGRRRIGSAHPRRLTLRDSGPDRGHRDLDVALGRLPVRHRDPYAGRSLPARRRHHAGPARADRLEHAVETGEPHDDLVDDDVVRDLDAGDLTEGAREVLCPFTAPIDEVGDSARAEALQRGPHREPRAHAATPRA